MEQDVRGWSWYDRRDDRRTTNATFLSYEAALERLNYWKARPMRKDLADIIEHVVVHEIPPKITTEAPPDYEGQWDADA